MHRAAQLFELIEGLTDELLKRRSTRLREPKDPRDELLAIKHHASIGRGLALLDDVRAQPSEQLYDEIAV
jgi:hypothetical protein